MDDKTSEDTELVVTKVDQFSWRALDWCYTTNAGVGVRLGRDFNGWSDELGTDGKWLSKRFMQEGNFIFNIFGCLNIEALNLRKLLEVEFWFDPHIHWQIL